MTEKALSHVAELALSVWPVVKRDPTYQAFLDGGLSEREAVVAWRRYREAVCQAVWGVPLSFFVTEAGPADMARRFAFLADFYKEVK